MQMPAKNLRKLRRQYSSALYSYFRITNLETSFAKFLKNPNKPPVFEYADDDLGLRASRRLKKLKAELKNAHPTDQKSISFIDWRLSETRILNEFAKLHKNGRTVSSKDVDSYLEAQMELYGPMDEELFGGIMLYLQALARQRGSKYRKILLEINELVGAYPKVRLFRPKESTFLHYKHLFGSSFPELHRVLAGLRKAENYSSGDVVDILTKALTAVRADEHGWRVEVSAGGANVVSSRYRKRIIVGSHFKPLSTLRLKQVVVHEVGGHVQSALDNQRTHMPLFDESDEGLAVMLEQLLSSRFINKRVLRYMAISLAVGVDGKKRDFCEVYDVLWRAAYIVGGNHQAKAKKQAFYETARAFRGGLPSVPGAAYLKDKVYLEGNLLVWRQLEDKLLSLKDFRSLFTAGQAKQGKRILL